VDIYYTKYGKFLLHPYDLISKELIKGNFWEPELLPVFNKYINKDSVVIEVGSYFGDHTVYLSKIAHSVYAYEGFKRNYYHLITNIFLNNCFNVYPLNYVIGNGETVREARDVDEWGPDWSYNAAGARFVAGTDITTYLLDDLYFTKVDFIKIDTEGMDLNVMLGGEKLILKNRPIIVFEYNEPISVPFKEYENYLNYINYSYEKIGWYNYLALPKD